MNNSKAFVPKQNRIKDRGIVSTVLLYFFAALIAFITIYPMYYVLVLSFSSPREALTMRVYWWPKGFFVDGYKRILTNSNLWLSYRNTIMYCATRAILTLATSVLAAYPLTVKHLYGRKFVTMFLLIPMYVSGGIIPEFILMTKLGLYNSPLALILPGSYAIFYIILVRSYFRTIPESLRESAKIDGANEWHIFWNICLPQCRSALYSIAILVFIDNWNMVEQPLILLNDVEKQPLSMFLSSINAGEIGIAFAAAVIYMIPGLLLFLHGEAYLVEGIAHSGSVKG